MLLETDGVQGEYLVDVVWPLDRIAESNADFRSSADFADLYAPFDGLLFFGDNGGGDQFAFSDGRVVVWEHETDTRREVATGLRDYIEKALTSGRYP
ncbi:SMI1/KNR4 family protein [Saccharothrix deserti]|uniref:SMI1/KNR4 family protein n=1 Tax=Saccharothrix deserti TaxID=2593674 RepID=UPI00192E42E3